MKKGGLLAAVLAGGGSAAADIMHLIDPTSHGEASHWSWRDSLPDGNVWNVYYFIDQAGVAFTAEEIDRIHDSAIEWSFDNTRAAVQLVEVFSILASNIIMDKAPIDGPGATRADTTFSFAVAHGPGKYPDGHDWHRLVSATVTFDSAETWYAGIPPPLPTQLDFWSYATHNIGHALGLGNANAASGEFPSVMEEPTGEGYDSVALQDLDKEALQHIYGMPEPSTLALFAAGLGVIGCCRRWRTRGASPS